MTVYLLAGKSCCPVPATASVGPKGRLLVAAGILAAAVNQLQTTVGRNNQNPLPFYNECGKK